MNTYFQPVIKEVFIAMSRSNMQGYALIPDCEGRGEACGTNVEEFCRGPEAEEAWVIRFELLNANCLDVPNPLTGDAGCRIEFCDPDKVECTNNDFEVMQDCFVSDNCSESGCENGAVYEITCSFESNEGTFEDDCDDEQLVRVVCDAGSSECDNPQRD